MDDHAPDPGELRYGTVLPAGTAPEQVELAVLAEQAGWDGVFVWEAAYGPDAWSMLAAMAARTSRVRLGTMLTPLPWRRPWKVASQVATLDQLSGGRAILAVGVGALDTDLPETGEVTGLRDRADRMDEGIDLIRMLWDGRPQLSRQVLRLRDRAAGPGRCCEAGPGPHPDLGGRRLASAAVDAAGAALRRHHPAIRRSRLRAATRGRRSGARVADRAGPARQLRHHRRRRDACRQPAGRGGHRSAVGISRLHLVAGDPMGSPRHHGRAHRSRPASLRLASW